MQHQWVECVDAGERIWTAGRGVVGRHGVEESVHSQKCHGRLCAESSPLVASRATIPQRPTTTTTIPQREHRCAPCSPLHQPPQMTHMGAPALSSCTIIRIHINTKFIVAAPPPAAQREKRSRKSPLPRLFIINRIHTESKLLFRACVAGVNRTRGVWGGAGGSYTSPGYTA